MANEKRLLAYDPITFESFTRHSTKHSEPDANPYDMGYVDAVEQIEDWLDANTVDAVKHGYWDDSGRYQFRSGRKAICCSLCGCALSESEYHRYNWNYCPVCGAKMDGDGNG